VSPVEPATFGRFFSVVCGGQQSGVREGGRGGEDESRGQNVPTAKASEDYFV
jgi:hypothetical protein